MAKEKPSRKAPSREDHIAAICKTINEGDFGGEEKDAVTWLGSRDKVILPRFPSGNPELDEAMGGGYPETRFIELFGPESVGKTTMLLHAIAEYQKEHPDRDVALIDVEFAFEEDYAENLGVKTKHLIVSQPDNGEQALNVAMQLLQLGVGLICVDSVAALTTMAEIEGDMGHQGVGEQARLMSRSLRKLAAAVKRHKATMIWTNQIRDKIGVTWGDKTTTPGGRALKHWASIRVEIKRIATIKEGTKDDAVVVCTRVRAEVKKNKTAPPFRKAEFFITFGHGIDKIAAIVDTALAKKVIVKRGSWFSFEDQQIACGRPAVMEALRTDVELSKKIEAATAAAVKEAAPASEKGPDGVERTPVTDADVQLGTANADDEKSETVVEDAQ